MAKYDYQIPKTNAEGLALVWTKIYPAELARQLSERAFKRKPSGKTISRAGTAKWRAVPLDRVNDVAEITGIPREHILPEVYADA